MSGGVDSSASAWLLKQQGHEEIGLFMRSGATEEAACATEAAAGLPIVSAAAHKQGCCSASDAADLDGYRRLGASGVTHVLTIPWVFYHGMTEDLDAKIDGIRRYGKDVIAAYD